MKEVTAVVTLRMTHIALVPDEKVEEVVKQNTDELICRLVGEVIARELGMDNVTVDCVQDFVRDV